MKRNLLIFGDSYAEEQLIAYPRGHYYHKLVHSTTSYHEILRRSELFSKIKVYAVGGSDLWSQFKLFKEHYTENDQVLWIITHPGRLSLSPRCHYPNLSSCLNLLHAHTNNPQLVNSVGNKQKITEINAAIEYFKYLKRNDYDMYVQESILNDILKISKDAILIPAFHDSFGTVPTEDYLGKLFIKENIVFNVDTVEKYMKKLETHYDLRRNHMIEENHVIFAEQLIERIRNGTEIDYSKFVYPDTKDIDKYFKLREY
jgi:hypothetical protein